MPMLDCCVILCSWSDFLDFRFVFDAPLPVSHLIALITRRIQTPMQTCGWRPLGVGLLIAGSGDMGPHVFKPVHLLTTLTAELCPVESVLIILYLVGKTYVWVYGVKFESTGEARLHALQEIGTAEKSLSTKNIFIGIVGKDMDCLIHDDAVSPFLEALEEAPQRTAHTACSTCWGTCRKGWQTNGTLSDQPVYVCITKYARMQNHVLMIIIPYFEPKDAELWDVCYRNQSRCECFPSNLPETI